MVRAGRTASACMPMRALQVRDERVMKLGTLDSCGKVHGCAEVFERGEKRTCPKR